LFDCDAADRAFSRPPAFVGDRVEMVGRVSQQRQQQQTSESTATPRAVI